MARGPLPVWRVTGSGPSDFEAPTTPLAGSHLEWFAFLFRRCAVEFHWSARTIDDLEVWEVGAALGVATTDVETWAKSRPTPEPGGVHSGRDLVAERIAAAKGTGPAPEADVMTPNQVRFIQETLRVG